MSNRFVWQFQRNENFFIIGFFILLLYIGAFLIYFYIIKESSKEDYPNISVIYQLNDKYIELFRDELKYDFLTITVIRTGAITITLILIKILIPFYKYNIRMASFYESRAYSLSLSGIDDLDRVKTFANVMATEKIEFDKNDEDYKDVLEFLKGIKG